MAHHITLDESVVAAAGFDVNELLEQLEAVTDRRHAQGYGIRCHFCWRLSFWPSWLGSTAHRPSPSGSRRGRFNW